MGVLEELRRRRVFTTGAIYIPVSWAAAEILLEICDRFDAPTWAGDVIVVLFLLGFPVAILLSWLFDLTADGVQRASPGTPLGIVALLASALFLSVSGYVAHQVFSGRLEEVRLVVLPLKAAGSDESARSYGAGVADNLRDSLRSIRPFKVTARTSSDAVAQSGMDIPAIAMRLGVQYIIEGTLEKIDERLRITLSIVDEGGDVLWSERFEDSVADIFSLQNRMVAAAAVQLGVEAGDQQLQSRVRQPPPTQDAEAHRLFLAGRYSSALEGDQGEMGAQRLALFKAARARDPGYAAVYPALAEHYATLCWGMDDRRSADCEMAISYARQGLELDPSLADAYATLAMIHAVRFEFPEAQAALESFHGLPASEVLSNGIPWAYVNLGRLQEAWNAAQRFYSNDPLNPFAAGNLSLWAYSMKRDLELSEHYEKIAVELTGFSILAGFPYTRTHRVGLEQALAEAAVVGPIWGDPEGLENIMVPPLYDPSLSESLERELDAWYERGEIRLAQYWSLQFLFGRVDKAMNMAFDLFQEGVFNPVPLWMHGPDMHRARAHPRFVELMETIGITAHWDQYGWPPFCRLASGEWDCGHDFAIE